MLVTSLWYILNVLALSWKPYLTPTNVWLRKKHVYHNYKYCICLSLNKMSSKVCNYFRFSKGFPKRYGGNKKLLSDLTRNKLCNDSNIDKIRHVSLSYSYRDKDVWTHTTWASNWTDGKPTKVSCSHTVDVIEPVADRGSGIRGYMSTFGKWKFHLAGKLVNKIICKTSLCVASEFLPFKFPVFTDDMCWLAWTWLSVWCVWFAHLQINTCLKFQVTYCPVIVAKW